MYYKREKRKLFASTLKIKPFFTKPFFVACYSIIWFYVVSVRMCKLGILKWTLSAMMMMKIQNVFFVLSNSALEKQIFPFFLVRLSEFKKMREILK